MWPQRRRPSDSRTLAVTRSALSQGWGEGMAGASGQGGWWQGGRGLRSGRFPGQPACPLAGPLAGPQRTHLKSKVPAP